jgi:hypothetical protein
MGGCSELWWEPILPALILATRSESNQIGFQAPAHLRSGTDVESLAFSVLSNTGEF